MALSSRSRVTSRNNLRSGAFAMPPHGERAFLFPCQRTPHFQHLFPRLYDRNDSGFVRNRPPSAEYFDHTILLSHAFKNWHDRFTFSFFCDTERTPAVFI